MAIQENITQKFRDYLGIDPSGKQVSGLSLKTDGEVDEILSDTRNEVQSEAAKTAEANIAALQQSIGGGTPEQDYIKRLTEGKQALEDQYGLTEAQEGADTAEQFYLDIAQKGPMFDTAMTGALMGASPTFLGATRKGVEQAYAGIANPFVRDRMVNDYMNAADRSLTSTLNALNGLYQSTLAGAQGAAEFEQKAYQRVADKVSDLYKEVQWLARDRYEEQSEIRFQELLKSKGLGSYTEGGLKSWGQEETNARIRQLLSEPELTGLDEDEQYQRILDVITLADDIGNKEEVRRWIDQFFGVESNIEQQLGIEQMLAGEGQPEQRFQQFQIPGVGGGTIREPLPERKPIQPALTSGERAGIGRTGMGAQDSTKLTIDPRMNPNNPLSIFNTLPEEVTSFE